MRFAEPKIATALCGVVVLALISAVAFGVLGGGDRLPPPPKAILTEDSPGGTSAVKPATNIELLQKLLLEEGRQAQLLERIAKLLAEQGGPDRSDLLGEHPGPGDISERWAEALQLAELKFVADEVVRLRARLQGQADRFRDTIPPLNQDNQDDPQLALDRGRLQMTEEALEYLSGIRTARELAEFKRKYRGLIPP